MGLSSRLQAGASPRVIQGVAARAPAPYRAELALTGRQMDEVFRLRFQSYHNGGFINANATRMFSDQYDGFENARSILIYQEGLPVASVRVCLLQPGSSRTLPAMSIFGDEIGHEMSRDPLPAIRNRAVELNRLVRSPAHEHNYGLLLILYRLAGYLAIAHHFRMMFCCVRTNHVSFYRRLGYDHVSSEPRTYPGLSCPMHLLSITRRRFDLSRRQFPTLDPFGEATGNLGGFFEGQPVPLWIAR